jgi:hypothetical protein
MDDGCLIDTLRWFLFQEYATPEPTWGLASCPLCAARDIPLNRANLTRDHTCRCSACGGELFRTDVFRLHEVIDDELGAGEILGYMTTTIEQFILVHLIRLLLKTKPALLHQILFIKDGPLAFFGQTANMHKPMRTLVSFLFQRHNLYLAGLEKSGPFVEHADEIRDLLTPSSVLLLDDPYIYRYVLPAKGESKHPYGSSTYYSQKLIFKTPGSQVYVVSLPTAEPLARPTEGDIRNLQIVLTNVEKLRCDMYDNALVPVALVNKLVSLANHPSSRILQKFAKDSVAK